MGPVNIRHHIATIRIDNLTDCWAAATAMVMRRHSMAGVEHVKSLAAAADVPLDAGTLPDSSVPLLARVVRLGLHDYQSRSLTLDELAGFLRRGPAAAFGYFNYPGRPTANKHAVAIFGLVGDGSARHTTIHLVDPYAVTNPFTDDWEHFTDQVSDITYVLSY